MTKYSWLPTFLAVLVGGLISGLASWIISMRRMPASYRVAVLGFPRSGKTTLITAVFAYLFRRGVRGASIVPRGDETIQRINDNMEQLELGRPLTPTTDQDVFAYRSEVRVKSLFVSRRYKLEIGDFPGENSVAFTEDDEKWLHTSKYFQWATTADAFLFVLDTAAILSDSSGEYVARQKRAFRAAWQRLQEFYLDGSGDLSKRPLILVFTKADVLLRDPDDVRIEYSPTLTNLNREQIEGLMRERRRGIEDKFSDLIEYFGRESRSFRTAFTSAFLNVDGERLGIPDVALDVMPRPQLFVRPRAELG